MSELAGKYKQLIAFVRAHYSEQASVPLHAPVFRGNEKRYLNDCIDSSFVSSVGEYVNRFEAMMCEITGAKYAVATMNGTAALHVSLLLAGVKANEEVLTQSLTFVATCNAIAYLGAAPVFVDVDEQTIGLSAVKLRCFLERYAEKTPEGCINSATRRRIAAILPMHTFGFPCDMEAIIAISREWQIPVVEDCAESLGSYIGTQHTGNFGLVAAFSFNGNKITTCGGGGCIITNDDELGVLAKHLTTTAKQPHPWLFNHDTVGFNYRMPNINAALGCAQLELLPAMLADKRHTAQCYQVFCTQHDIHYCRAPAGTQSNYWLNTVLTSSVTERDALLEYAAQQQVMCRPVWTPMHLLPMYATAQHDELENTLQFAARIVNLPSSARIYSGN